MRASEIVILAALAASCSKSADKVSDPPPPAAAAPNVAVKGVNSFEDCTKFVDKAQPVIEEMTKKAGLPFGPGEISAFVTECTTSTAPRTPLMDCVLAAKDEAAVRTCYGAAAKPTPP